MSHPRRHHRRLKEANLATGIKALIANPISIALHNPLLPRLSRNLHLSHSKVRLSPTTGVFVLNCNNRSSLTIQRIGRPRPRQSKIAPVRMALRPVLIRLVRVRHPGPHLNRPRKVLTNLIHRLRHPLSLTPKYGPTSRTAIFRRTSVVARIEKIASGNFCWLFHVARLIP